ncbi:MAG: helix-turn-helix domain-containing protein [Nanoarchaeota archaeon]|nr:helix-turn-helix domain-containing protein [Nanoarchaeota archaeon]
MEHDYESEIRELITETPSSDTMGNSIAKKLGISRNTVGWYLKMLERDGEISYQKIGPCKLWYKLSDEEIAKNKVKKLIDSSNAVIDYFRDNEKYDYMKDCVEELESTVKSFEQKISK